MAFRKTLARRFLNLTQSSAFPTSKSLIPPNPLRKYLSPPQPGELGFFRRLLQKRQVFQSAAPADNHLGIPVGDKLREQLRLINGDRLRLEGLSHPSPVPSEGMGISVEEARKILRLSQMQAVKTALRGVSKSCVSYSEFIRICEGCFEGFRSEEEVLGTAKMLDESGVVLVVGDVVFLRPEQVIKAIESVIPLSVAPHREEGMRKELERMEREKTAIDMKAESLVRRELWTGLGFLMVQTVGFMRLTFWELSWDVMEPICFFVTSIYFMAGYGFFLRTAKDPSFEGFFETRFATKQKKLMKAKKFDVERLNELRMAFDPLGFSSSTVPSHRDSLRGTLAGAVHHH